jgi:hypothetical protein
MLKSHGQVKKSYVYSSNLDIGLTGIAIGSSILSSELPRNAADWSGVEFTTRAPDLPVEASRSMILRALRLPVSQNDFRFLLVCNLSTREEQMASGGSRSPLLEAEKLEDLGGVHCTAGRKPDSGLVPSPPACAGAGADCHLTSQIS